MIRLVSDENFDGDIVRGLRRRAPTLDLVRVQDGGLISADDPTLLEWAAREGRLLLTHDAKTMTRHAYERIVSGLAMPGVIQVSHTLPIGRAIEEILYLAAVSREREWEGQVVCLPL